MTCRELVELVTAYFDGALPDEAAHDFEAHIGACSGCRHYVEQMRVTIRAVGRIEERDLSPEAKSALLAAFEDWRGSA